MSPPILGLIGGIGSGKSLIAAEFARHNGYLINADALGHEALEQEDIKKRIVERWGQDILDEKGRVRRRKLGSVVFADERELRALEALVFPYIGKRIREEIGKAAGAKFVILDAAVMMEAGWDRECDKVIFVDAPAEVRAQRLREGRGWLDAEIESREKAQLSLDAKRARADHVIDNAEPTPELLEKAGHIVEADREILHLRFAHGNDFRKIAEILEINPQAAEMRMNRALGRLAAPRIKKILEDLGIR